METENSKHGAVQAQEDVEKTAWHEDTPEEEIYFDLLDEKQETLSKMARILLKEVQSDSYKWNFYPFKNDYQGKELEEAMKLMDLLASAITEQDRKALREIVHAASLAALSIDPDGEAPLWYKVNEGDLYSYYKQLCLVLNKLLQESPQEPIEDPQEPMEDPQEYLENPLPFSNRDW